MRHRPGSRCRVTVNKVDLPMGPYATGNILSAMGVAVLLVEQNVAMAAVQPHGPEREEP